MPVQRLLQKRESPETKANQAMKQEVSHVISCFMVVLHPFIQEINKGPSNVNKLEIFF